MSRAAPPSPSLHATEARLHVRTHLHRLVLVFAAQPHGVQEVEVGTELMIAGRDVIPISCRKDHFGVARLGADTNDVAWTTIERVVVA